MNATTNSKIINQGTTDANFNEFGEGLLLLTTGRMQEMVEMEKLANRVRMAPTGRMDTPTTLCLSVGPVPSMLTRLCRRSTCPE
jgi:hypothetical protein